MAGKTPNATAAGPAVKKISHVQAADPTQNDHTPDPKRKPQVSAVESAKEK